MSEAHLLPWTLKVHGQGNILNVCKSWIIGSFFSDWPKIKKLKIKKKNLKKKDCWPEILMFIYKLINYLWSFFCIPLAFFRYSLLYINSFLRQCILQTILHTTVYIWIKIAIPEFSSNDKTGVTCLALRWPCPSSWMVHCIYPDYQQTQYQRSLMTRFQAFRI